LGNAIFGTFGGGGPGGGGGVPVLALALGEEKFLLRCCCCFWPCHVWLFNNGLAVVPDAGLSNVLVICDCGLPWMPCSAGT